PPHTPTTDPTTTAVTIHNNKITTFCILDSIFDWNTGVYSNTSGGRNDLPVTLYERRQIKVKLMRYKLKNFNP
ncbi:MAG: hypothetical protein PVI55_08170, partial [Desulfobacterales bacterium]